MAPCKGKTQPSIIRWYTECSLTLQTLHVIYFMFLTMQFVVNIVAAVIAVAVVANYLDVQTLITCVVNM